MKSMNVKSALLILICLLFAFESNLVAQSMSKDKQVILMRKIGNELMEYLGDSTSNLKPIREVSENEYQIEFNSEFTFVTDSVSDIISNTVEQYSSNKEFLVKFIECTNEEIIWGYAIGMSEIDTLLPCGGREQPISCYLLNITFPQVNQEAVLANNPSFFKNPENLNGLASLFALGIIAFLIFRFYNSKPFEDMEKQDPDELPFIKLGKFMFFPDEELLQMDDESINLTNKEVRILELLASRPNQVVERDFIQKQVWEDEGVIVGRSLDMFISKLRKKLSGDPTISIKNVHGKGYKLRFT